jgi:hypothetical protein
MKGPKWLEKLNEEELKDFPLHPKWQVPHYIAGPGTGRVLQDELYEYASGITLEFSITNLQSERGAKYWREVFGDKQA